MKSFAEIKKHAFLGCFFGLITGITLIRYISIKYNLQWEIANYPINTTLILLAFVVICAAFGTLVGICTEIVYQASIKKKKQKKEQAAAMVTLDPKQQAELSAAAAMAQEAHEKKVAFEKSVSEATFEDPEPVNKNPGKKLTETPATIFSHTEEVPPKPELEEDSYPKKQLGLYVPRPSPHK